MNAIPRGHLLINHYDSSIEYIAIVNTEAFFLCVAISEIAIKATFISLLQLISALPAAYTAISIKRCRKKSKKPLRQD